MGIVLISDFLTKNVVYCVGKIIQPSMQHIMAPVSVVEMQCHLCFLTKMLLRLSYHAVDYLSMHVAYRDFSILSITHSFLDGLDMFQMNIICKCISFSVILVRACRVQM